MFVMFFFTTSMGDIDIPKRVIESVVDQVVKACVDYLVKTYETLYIGRKAKNELLAMAKAFLSGNDFDVMVFPDSIQKEIELVQETLKMDIEDSNSRFGVNVILSGPPGGGKSALMKHWLLYAMKVAEDYNKKNRLSIKKSKKVIPYLFPGSFLRKMTDIDANQVINNMFDEVSKAIKNGDFAYIGIDEADALLGKDFSQGNKRSDLLTSILSRISILESQRQNGESKGNFCIICTTNVPGAIEAAMGRRFNTSIVVGASDVETITKQYISHLKKNMQDYRILLVKKYKSKYKDHDITFRITYSFLKKMVEVSSMLMGGEIANIVNWAFLFTLIKGGRVVTESILISCLLAEMSKRLDIVDKIGIKKSEYCQDIVALVRETILKEYKKYGSYGVNNQIRECDINIFQDFPRPEDNVGNVPRNSEILEENNNLLAEDGGNPIPVSVV